MSNHDRDKPIQGGVGRILPGRVFERTMGCFNCVHFENGRASREFFQLAKRRDLATANVIEKQDRRGRNSPKVLQIRQMVHDAEENVKAGLSGLCLSKKAESEREATGKKSDFFVDTFLCHHWSGKVGVSVDRAGSGLDTLPDELRDKIGD